MYQKLKTITKAMRKRGLIFYHNLVSVNDQRFTSRVLNAVSKAMETRLVRNDLEQK